MASLSKDGSGWRILFVCPTTKAFLDGFIEQRRRRGDVTDSTLIVWGHTRRNLIAFFGADRLLRSITPSDADDWSGWLRNEEGLSENTCRKRTQFAKGFLSVAEQRGLLDRNPFRSLVGRLVPVPERQFFVDRATIDALLDQCHGPEYRLLLIFARYMGVRVPSEIVPLKWSDVDWEGQRIIITSPKTKRHRGHDRRVCPIFPEVLPFLQEAWDAAPEGATWIFPSIRSREKNLRTWLQKAILKTGRTPWPRLWVNLRASRATELADKYPSHVGAAWLGHTETIADAHYRQVTAEHYDRAAQEATGIMPTFGRKKLAQKPAQSPHVLVNQGSSRNETSPANPEIGEACETMTTPPLNIRRHEPRRRGGRCGDRDRNRRPRLPGRRRRQAGLGPGGPRIRNRQPGALCRQLPRRGDAAEPQRRHRPAPRRHHRGLRVRLPQRHVRAGGPDRSGRERRR